MRRINTYLAFVIAGIVAGGALPAILYGFSSRSVVNGMIIGAAVALTLATLEHSRLSESFRRMPFLQALVLRTMLQIAIVGFYAIVFVLVLKMLRDDVSLAGAYSASETQRFLYGGDLLYIVIYALTALFLINLVRQMNRMLGQNVLLNVIAGKYSRPVEEERIFMFLDLDASTTLAERLGNIRFHELIDDYIYDITPAITSTGGEIYQYVGDEIVVTWKNGTLKSAINCIDCFFSVNHIMDSLAPKYIAKYGDAPAYKAGIHSGKVIVGVIGDIKKEIVFQGDVVNTASRIKEKCHSLGAKILVSHDLLAEIPKDELKYNAERVGSFLLKGKEHEVELYSITEA